jgi:hypothetical protein
MIIRQVLDHFVEYVSKDENRTTLEARILNPMVVYIRGRFAWLLTLFQGMIVLVALQTLLLVWLCWSTYRMRL